MDFQLNIVQSTYIYAAVGAAVFVLFVIFPLLRSFLGRIVSWLKVKRHEKKARQVAVLALPVLALVIFCWNLTSPPIRCQMALQSAHKRFEPGSAHAPGYSYSCIRETFPVCSKAAEQGDIDAMIFMGESYYQGYMYLGCFDTADRKEAAKWYDRVEAALIAEADRGDAFAAYELGHLYSWTMLQNNASATAWFKKAADAGYDTTKNFPNDKATGELYWTCARQTNGDQPFCFR